MEPKSHSHNELPPELAPQPTSSHIEENSRERLGLSLELIRHFFTRTWKIALLLAKGAYLTTERRQLFRRLGEITFQKIQNKELASADLEPIVHQLERLGKKIEVEERVIQHLRSRMMRVSKGHERRSTGSENLNPDRREP